MKKLLFLTLSIFIFLISSNSYAENIEKLMNAFKKGFLEHKITGDMVYEEMTKKYKEKPLLYVQLLDTYRKYEQGPIFVVVYKTKIDKLGRMVIYPELKITTLKADDFPEAFYLLSLLEYKKDFLDFEKLEKQIDQTYREISPNGDDDSNVRVLELE